MQQDVKELTPLFFLGPDEDDDKRQVLASARKLTSAPLSRVLSRASEMSNIDDVLLFPVENSHAYSYAHLSPNSLALRLNVLKRSLEILNERPDWVKLLKSSEDQNQGSETPAFEAPDPFARAADRRLFKVMQAYSRNGSGEHLPTPHETYKLSSNASSAALSALFRPNLSRAESVPAIRGGLPSLEASRSLKPIHDEQKDDLDLEDTFAEEVKDIIELIEQDHNLLALQPDIAATLHDLSLSSGAEGVRKKQDALKTKLLFALATPFVESSGITTSLLGTPTAGFSSINTNASSPSLNFLPSHAGQQQGSAPNRPFHVMSAGKHTSPQSIVTVESDFPWSFKAANDLACLMFGVLKSMIKNLTLIDLIAPQFRSFVTDRLTKAIGNFSDRHSPHNNRNIIFAGEIIAISRHAEGDFAWTSIWAQKKGNMIICMFEQITCDAFDVTLLCDVETYPKQLYSVKSVEEVAGKLVSKLDAADTRDLTKLSEAIYSDIKILAESHEEADQCDWEDSSLLNRHRYFTLQLSEHENIPCALTSYPLEKDDQKYEIKLKIHSMPYIAGMFVVDFATFNVLSCNKAIAKNLFGVSHDDLLGSSIDKVIPMFSKILQTGLSDQDSTVKLVPGMVLPEHFFRKYSAILTCSPEDKRSPEQRFLASRGIEGLHRDGKLIHIDVQLRVVRSDIFVLWVTYSRHSTKNIHKHMHKLSNSNVNEISLPRRQRSTNSTVNLPSQMKLFPKDESDILELGSSSSEVSRNSSTRRPKRASTFAVPVTYVNEKAREKRMTSFSSKRSVSNSVATATGSETLSRPASSSTRATENSFEQYYENFSESEILALENKELESRRKASKFWPTTIGEKKRTKKYSEFKVVKKMGEGAYGKVVLAEHKDDPFYRVIIKCIDKQRILVDTWVRDRQLGTIPSEIQVMATLNHEPHPNIMRIVDYFEDPDYYYLETPVFGDPPAIDLFDYIEIKHDMCELDCQLIFKQVVLAIYHLHKHGIVHRDIKDENIIVNERGVVKLIDFGSAGYVKLGPFDVFVGTIDYASPEVLRGEKYEGKPQDIWALGILLYTLLYKENPFYNVDEIMEGELKVPHVVSEKLLNLIEKLLVRDVEKRPTITDVAEHPWLDV